MSDQNIEHPTRTPPLPYSLDVRGALRSRNLARWVLAVAGAASCVAACSGSSAHKGVVVSTTSAAIVGPANVPALRSDYRVTNGMIGWENTAKVVPPRVNGNCEDGALLMSLGQGWANTPSSFFFSPDDAAGSLLTRPLYQSNRAALDVSTLASGTPYSSFDIGPVPTIPVLQMDVEAMTTTDNQIVRLRNGNVLAMHTVKTWAPLPSTIAWANTPVSFNDPASPKVGERNEELFMASADCGQTWQRYGALDSGNIANGVFGWPQPSCAGKTGLACQIICTGTSSDIAKCSPNDAGSAPDGANGTNCCAGRVGPLWGNGGFDRPELYQDPFSDWLFVSAAAAAGPTPSSPPAGTGPVTTGILLGSQGAPSGNLDTSTWKVLNAALPPLTAPFVMTTTPNRRLYTFTCTGGAPTLWYTTNPQDPSSFIASGFNLASLNSAAPPCQTAENDIGRNAHFTIARVSANTQSSIVRIAYPTLNASGTQSIALLTVQVSDQNPAAAPAVVTQGVIQPSNPQLFSAEFATFIEPDFIDTPPGFTSNTAALYWIESTSNAGGGLDIAPAGCVRFKFFGSQFPGGDGNGPGPFSLSGTTNGGCFNVPFGFSIGDYMTGGFFWDKHRLNFLGQWLEPDGIHANVMGISPIAKRAHQLGVPGDVNGDGTADLVVFGASTPVFVNGTVINLAVAPVALSNGDGTFNVLSPQAMLIGGAQSATGDFSGDGLTDVLGLNSDGSIWISTSQVSPLNGVPTFSFAAPAKSSTTFGPFGNESSAVLLTGDFDGDGLTDFLATGPSGWNTIPMAFSNGDGTFVVKNTHNTNSAFFAAVAFQAGANKVVVGDFDGDGVDDLAATGGPGWGTLPVAFSNGDGTFRTTNASTTFQEFTSPVEVQVFAGDFDGDGRSDILELGIAPGATSIAIAYSNGDGTFRVSDLMNGGDNGFLAAVAGQPQAKIVVGDFNGDGLDDVAATGGLQSLGGPPWTTLPVALSNGLGGFTASNFPSTFQTYSGGAAVSVASSWK
jgi:FG-GAP-like repeat